MGRGRKNAKAAGNQGRNDPNGKKENATSGSDSTASSSSNSTESPNASRSQQRRGKGETTGVDKTRWEQKDRTASLSSGGEPSPPDSRFSKLRAGENAPSEPPKPHMAGETSVPASSIPFPQNETEYAATLNLGRKKQRSDDADAVTVPSTQQSSKLSKPPSLGPSLPFDAEVPTCMEQWSLNHGAPHNADPNIALEGPQFDANLMTRLDELDPRSPLPPQMAHLTDDQYVTIPSVSGSEKHQTSGLKSKPASRGSTSRYSANSSLLPANDRREYMVTPMEDPAPRPRTSHFLHGLLCLACCGLWLPCWIGACTGTCCARPFETAAHCCDRSKKPTFETV